MKLRAERREADLIGDGKERKRLLLHDSKGVNERSRLKRKIIVIFNDDFGRIKRERQGERKREEVSYVPYVGLLNRAGFLSELHLGAHCR